MDSFEPISITPSRRQVLGGVSAAALAAVLIPGGAAEAAPGARTIDLGAGWKFTLVNTDEVTDPSGGSVNAPQPWFDDSAWQDVDLPHDWSIELAPVERAGTSSATGFFPGGLGWYRRTFTVAPSLAGQRIGVEFDGVSAEAEVYLNGVLLGKHPYAYTGFQYDVTGRAHADGVTPNVLAVRARNRLPSSRWYSGSGIYRGVRLVVTDPVHVARHGTFVTTPGLASSIGSGYATAQVETTVANDSVAAVAVDVRTAVLDAAGRTVASGTVATSVPAGSSRAATTAMRITGPRLWSVQDPYRYRVRTDVVVGGAVRDTTTTEFGFRFTTFDPVRGFSLNGKAMKLQGVDLHSTQGPLGAVVDADAIERQLKLMKGMGVNAVRTAHNPPAPELVALCDRLGILLMVEAFDCWRSGKVDYDYHLYFDEWSERDIAEMVHAAKNSPAVVLWSIGNEVPDAWKPEGPAIAGRLIAAVRAIDPTRPVVMGSDQYRSVPAPGSPQDLILRQLDGIGLNYNTAQSVDGLHATYPDKFFFESESSSETSTRGVYQDPQLLNTGENHTPGKRGTSSYDNNLASWTLSGEYSLKKDRDRQFFQGQFLWAGQDYLGEPTPYDVFPVKASFFGAVDTAGLPKDAFHLFRSQWITEPMVHLVPMDWTTHKPGAEVSVWVYANVETVELQLNGKSLGSKSFTRKVTGDGRAYLETSEPSGDDRNHPSGSYTSPNGGTGKLHLTWPVPFRPGTLVAIGRAGGREVARDTLITAGPAHAVALTVERGTEGTMSFVTASVVDAHGVVVPDAADLLRFTVTGAGRLAGVDNGCQESAQGYQNPAAPAFKGKAVAVVAANGARGRITVTVTAPGLVPATTTLPGSPKGRRNGPGARAAGAVSAVLPPPADASYSGAPDTIPARMLDGDPATGWSNYYLKPATANLKAVSSSRPSDWVSLSWPAARRIKAAAVTFVVDGTLTLPATIEASYRTKRGFVPVNGLHVEWATGSGQPTTLTFDPVDTGELRVTMTSPAPGTGTGFLRITAFTVS